MELDKNNIEPTNSLTKCESKNQKQEYNITY